MSPSIPTPLLGLTVGDPAGIGPEIAFAALADGRVRESSRLVVIGPRSLCPDSVPPFDDGAEADVAWLATEAPDAWRMGEAQADCGRAALAALRAGAELASSGRVAALVTGPVCKEALHLAGERVEGQTELLARWAGVERFEMLGIAGRLRVMLLTRHLPLREALLAIETGAVVDRLVLLDETLRGLGIGEPHLALAGLNPHAGEHGILGTEEIELLEPAVATARERGVDVTGPVSPDSVFLQASRGEFDGVLALYHDQAFVPLKLLSEGRGVTLLAGLPYLRVSPVHGTAFDIAGKGVADPGNLVSAIVQAADWARARVRGYPDFGGAG